MRACASPVESVRGSSCTRLVIWRRVAACCLSFDAGSLMLCCTGHVESLQGSGTAALTPAIRTCSSALKLSVNTQYIQFVNSFHSGRRPLPVVPERSAEEPGQRYSRGRQSPNKAFNALAIDPFTEINSEILAGPESHFEGTP